MKRFLLVSFLALLATFLTGRSAFAATGGACPTGANYLSLTAPQTGGGLGSVTLASLGVTSCFYVSAAGSDSNAGTSESSPWLHAPGMPACTATCGSTSIAGGNGIILRGGDAWHKATGSPLTGGGWAFSGKGTSASPIYIGIDVTWFSGSSFARPILNEDNPITTAAPSSCPHPDDGATFFDLSGSSHVIADGLEFTGDCTSGGSNGGVVDQGVGASSVIERFYVHGWSMANSAQDDSHVLIGIGNGNNPDNTDRDLFNVVDGADSTWGNVCTSQSCVGNFTDKGGAATGWGMSSCWDVEYSIIRHSSQGLECGDASIFHDNLLEFIFEPNFGGRHGNIFEVTIEGAGTLCSNFIAYNNVTRNTNDGVDWWIQCPNYYIFNNVWSDSGHYPPDPNGLLLSPPGASGSSKVTAHVFNNTFQANSGGAGPSNSATPSWASGSTATLQNNHIMDFTSVSSFFPVTGSGNNGTLTDAGGQVFQTTSATNSQGYTLANNYAPTTSTDATVGKGINATALCATIPNALAAAACTSGMGGVVEVSNWGGQFASYPAIPVVPRPATGAWDAGAYQFSSSSSSSGKPNPPTGLKAVAQ